MGRGKVCVQSCCGKSLAGLDRLHLSGATSLEKQLLAHGGNVRGITSGGDTSLCPRMELLSAVGMPGQAGRSCLHRGDNGGITDDVCATAWEQRQEDLS